MSFIGIDVAKIQLEFAHRPSGATGRVPNDESGIAALVAQCQAAGAILIVCEATGGYEAAVVAALATASLPVVTPTPPGRTYFRSATASSIHAVPAHRSPLTSHRSPLLSPHPLDREQLRAVVPHRVGVCMRVVRQR